MCMRKEAFSLCAFWECDMCKKVENKQRKIREKKKKNRRKRGNVLKKTLANTLHGMIRGMVSCILGIYSQGRLALV